MTTPLEDCRALAAQDPLAGPWLRSYKRIAEHYAMQKGQQVRDETPWEV
jgi:hypothetical protein